MKEIEVNKKTKHESYLTSFALPPNSSFNIPAPKKKNTEKTNATKIAPENTRN